MLLLASILEQQIMRKISILLSAFLLCITISNAQTSATDTAQHVTLDTMEVTAPAAAPEYRGFATRVWDIKHTRIALTFNWKAKTADAREWIKLHPYFYATDTLMLDAKSMRIDSILLVGRKGNTKVDYTYANDQIKIRFGHEYQASDTIELYLKYTAMPYAAPTGGSGAITDDRGLYFINTDYSVPHKPAQIWTQGETESNSHWMVTIDKPNTRTTTQVELTVPDSFVTLSNGYMAKSVKNNNKTHTDIWKMDQPIQAYVVMFAIGKFSIVKDHWKNKEVNYYVEPEYAPYAKTMFKHTPEMMDYFSQITGVPFPWNKYDQVVVRDYVSGAMENTTASLFGEFMNQNGREIADNDWEDVVSHELFHMWFGDYVTTESWSNITVNESFANYGETLWRTHEYGKAAGDAHAYAELQGYLGSAQMKDPQLVRYYYDSREEVFDAISYNKGGAVLRYLNSLTGDAAFDRAMYLYLSKNALHSGEAQGWRMAVEEATGQDWNWFFNEWYYHPGHPTVKVFYMYNDTTQKLTVAVSQTQSDSTFNYELPIKTAVIYGNEKTIVNWHIYKRKDTFTYAYKNGLRPVIVPDCNHVVPGDIRDNKKPIQYVAQFMNSDDYVSKRLALSAAGRLMSDSSSQVIIDLALNDTMRSIRRMALSQLQDVQTEKYRKKWTGKIIDMAAGDKDKLVRAEAYRVLGEWKVNKAKQNLLSVLYDSSYSVAGAALSGLNKIDKDTAYVLAKDLLKTDPRGSLESAIWSIIGKRGADEDIALFEHYGPYVLGTKKFTFASSLNSYLKNVKSDASFKRCVDVYLAMIVSENMKGYRGGLGGFLFQVASEEKGNLKSDKPEDAATAKTRMDILKTALTKMTAAEKDPETKKDFEKSMKETFE